MQSDEAQQQSDASSSPYSRPSELRQAPLLNLTATLHLGFTLVCVVWTFLCGLSIAVLLFYRFSPVHAHDMVGKKMTAFLSPLVLAFLVSIVCLLTQGIDGHCHGKIFLYTILLAVAELIIYGTVLLP
jgi:hypothetical protein